MKKKKKKVDHQLKSPNYPLLVQDIVAEPVEYKSNGNNNNSSSIKSKKEIIELARWMEMYRQLIVYQQENDGSTKVHQKDKNNSKLGRWVASQRTKNNSNNLYQDRKSLLNSIDFDWGTGKQDWMETYQQLVAFKKQYNTTNVPCKYKVNSKFYNWVSTQRSDFRNKTMMDERYQLLHSIGFQWDLRARGASKDTITSNMIGSHHQSYVPNNDTTNTTAVSSSSSSSHLFSPSQRGQPVDDDTNNNKYIDDADDNDDDDDDESKIIVI